MSSIPRSQRYVWTLLLGLALICTAQPLYSASPSGRVAVSSSRIEYPAVPAGDQTSPARRVGESEIPVAFEANLGQAGHEIKFISRSAGHTVFISPEKTVITVHKPEPLASQVTRAVQAGAPSWRGRQAADNNSTAWSVEMRVLGGSRSPKIEGVNQLTGKANYFIGQDSKRWRTGIQMFGGVRERSVYPGIDLLFHGSRVLEYDFILAPGANPSMIGLTFNGADSVRLDGEELVLTTPAGELRQRQPVAYQEAEGIRKEVASKYEIKSKGRGRIVRFRLGSYDRHLPLVIDPPLLYSGYVGSKANLLGCTVDAQGNAYLAGGADPTSFPVTGPPSQSGASQLAFLAKLDPQGGLIYSTTFGGSVGAGVAGVAADAGGNAYVVGGTSSPDFPVTNGAFQTVKMAVGFSGFVTKFDPNGSQILYSTFLSGSFEDSLRCVAVDTQGNAYVAGLPFSSDFPTTPGAFQTVDRKPSFRTWGGTSVTKVNAAGTALIYSTFLDGTSDGAGGQAAPNFVRGIAVDSLGNAVVVGTASSPDFPVTSASFQPNRYGISKNSGYAAFVTKINASGSGLVFSSYVGDATNGNGVAVDQAGNVYVTGSALPDDFPAVNAIQSRITGGVILKTADGGQTSANVGNGLPPLAASYFNAVVDPSNSSRVFAGLNGLLFRSEDGGASWSQSANGLPAPPSAVYQLAIDHSNSSNLFVGIRSQTSGALFASNDNGDHWHQVSTVPDGAIIAVDPKNASTIYATNSLIHDYTATGTTLVKSSDGGTTWNPAGQGLPGGNIYTLVIDPANTSNLYAGTDTGVFRSNDGGGHWVGTAVRNYAPSIAVDPADPSVIYALDLKPQNGQFFTATSEGRGHSKKRAAQNTELDGVIKSMDGGSTWVSINTGLFVGMSLAVLGVDAVDGTVYLGAFEGLFKSANQGQQWDAAPNLVSRATFRIGVDPRNRGTLYLGGEVMMDAFVTKLAPDGASAVYSTLLGGFGQDDARCIAVDAAGEVFIAGATNSGNFPVTANAFQREWSGGDDVYVAEINAAGTAVLYATYVGGSDDDEPTSIAVDPPGNPVVIGVTQSTDFPTKDPAGRPFFSSAGRMFAFKIATQGSSSSRQPQITNASISGKRLIVSGQSFDEGAVIMVGGRDLPTISDALNPSSMLVSKKGGKRIAAGERVTIQVRNSDGTMSDPYSYTRPAN